MARFPGSGRGWCVASLTRGRAAAGLALVRLVFSISVPFEQARSCAMPRSGSVASPTGLVSGASERDRVTTRARALPVVVDGQGTCCVDRYLPPSRQPASPMAALLLPKDGS